MRRVFSRSELRKTAVEKTRVEYSDPERPRVKKWSKCPSCLRLTPTYQMEVDHVAPIVPLNISFEDMSLDDLVDRIWCEQDKLQGICKPCHKEKTKLEQKQRRENKKKAALLR